LKFYWKKNTAMSTIRGLILHKKPHERIIAMSKHNVMKSPSQFKLFLDLSALPQGLEIETLIAELQLELGRLASHTGTILVQMLMEAEVARLVGKRYSRDGERYRWGSQPGFVELGGQKVHVQRPRVRERLSSGTREVPLKSYLKFQQSGDRAIRAFEAFLAQVSTRDYPAAIESMRAGYGISKSVVSREVVAATTAELDRFRSRSLVDFDLCVLLIDGIELDETVFIAALGVDREGRKRFLGFLEGATENSVVCKAMLEDLISRGLRLDQPFLAVLDGAKALSKAVRDISGDCAIIQRCQEHKRRNVLSYLPPHLQDHFNRKLRAAYGLASYDDARRALLAIIRELERISEAAARSLQEGLEETLTVQRLQLSAALRTHFRTTNSIESAYARTRKIMKNVKRWSSSRQKNRWIATALLKAEKGFRRLSGHADMPNLTAALNAEYQRRTLERIAA
jgi:putative transposase